MSNVSEAASWIMWHLVTHDGDGGHGYSQPNRHGTGGPNTGDFSAAGGEVINVPGWGEVRIHSGDYDCSEAAIDCYGFLGIPVGGATYTGNERQGLTSTGLFTAYRAGTVTPRDGDILLREGHTEMVVNGGREQAGFRRSERHSITGRTGDQDGYESTHSPLAIGSWTWVIRYTGPDRNGPGIGTCPDGNRTRPDSNGTPSDSLAVDGLIGPASVRRWQQVMGTAQDGVISGQPEANRKYHRALTSVRYERGYSTLVKAVQGAVGTTQDGWLGPATIRAIQLRLGVTADGYFGTITGRALQRRLNEGRF